MLSPSQRTRIARRCADALTTAIEAFPQFLADSEPEAAAAIVADLIKAQLNRPESQSDAEDELIRVIRLANSVQ